MSEPANNPWYRRLPPNWLPAWLAVALAAATAGGLGTVYLGGFSAGTVAAVSGLGFFAGLVFSLAMADWPGEARSPAAARFRPPAWVAVPVGVAVLVLFAHGMIAETLRQGYAHGYRRGGYYRLPGPLAVGIGCCCLAAAGLISLGWMWGERRTASPFVGGVLGLAVLIVGVCVILARVWGRLA